MKTAIQIFIILNFIALTDVQAAKLDLATHDNLIQKLESVLNTDSTEASSDTMLLQSNMASRLADLYAERARLLSMDQQGKGEQIHAVQISRDRKKSISILNSILTSLDSSAQGPALLQMAHLHALQNETQPALEIIQRMAKNSSRYDLKTNALVQIQLGDSAFGHGQLSEAKQHFEAATKIKKNPRLAYCQFRLAWINFNEGQFATAEKQLIQLLKSIQSDKTNSGIPDTSFQEEVSHDLALFMTKNTMTDEGIQSLSALSPENSRKKNLIFLASELDRTSKKTAALKVWKVIGAKESNFDDQLERQVQVTRIEYDLGHKDELVKELKQSLILLKQKDCLKNEECTVAKQNLRRVLTDWAKAEERLPSAALINAFEEFTFQYADEEMNYWAAQAALQRKDYLASYAFYSNAIAILKAEKNKTAAQLKMYEGSFLGSLETAELSKNDELRLKAYSRYLELNVTGAKVSEVKYQLAHWYYEKNNFPKASEEFLKLALDKRIPVEFREKAGDLCLDSDVLLKSEPMIEAHALELSKSLTSKKDEYLSIYRKSILNQSARILNESIETAYEKELTKLEQLNLTHFTPDLSRQIAKNKLELSFRLKNLNAVEKIATELLAMKKISPEDQEIARRHLAWVAELKMNFKLAVHFLSQIKPTTKDQADHAFKIATLQELAQINPTKAYEKFLSISTRSHQNAFAAHQIVIFSKKPSQAFSKYQTILQKDPSLFSSAGLFVFEKTKDQNLLKHLLQNSALKKSFEGQVLAHWSQFQELKQINTQMKKAVIKGKSEKTLTKAIVARNKMIQKIESLANTAIKKKDTVLQIVYLAQIADDKKRLASDILNLPLPKSLKADEKLAYQSQVQALVKPYQDESQVVIIKTQNLWKEALVKNSFLNQAQCLAQNTKPGCQLATEEVTQLRAAAGLVGVNNDGFEKLSEQHQKTLSEAQTLSLKVQENPFNLNDLAKLKIIQSSLGRGPMVAYIDSRMEELKTKRGRN